MARSPWLPLADLVLPGSGLVLAGRLLAGLPLILLALACATLALVAGPLTGEVLAHHLEVMAMAVYGGAAVLAGTGHLLFCRSRPRREVPLREAYRACAVDLLHERPAEALGHARAVARAAPGEPGAWLLVALAAELAGRRRLAGRSRRSARRLVLRQTP